MTQEHKKEMTDYAVEKSSSPSDAYFIAHNVQFGYSLAETHYQVIIDKLRGKLQNIVNEVDLESLEKDDYCAEVSTETIEEAKQLLSETEPK